MKLLRLTKLARARSPRLCPFCSSAMVLVNSQEPQLELEACRSCNIVWFDEPTYETLPELALDSTNSMAMQVTEIIAMDHLAELRKKLEEESKKKRKKKLLHRDQNGGEDSATGEPQA